MISSWQAPYEAALREKDPNRLPARLTVAEKAIFHRLQELPEGAHDLPESQALREALNHLYALFPKEHYAPGQIEDEDAEAMRRNWVRLVVPVGLGLTLAFAIAWSMARRNEREYAQRMAGAGQKEVFRNPRTSIVPPDGLPTVGIPRDTNRASHARGASSGPDHNVAQAPAANSRPEARAGVKNREDVQTSTNVAADAAADGRSNAAVAETHNGGAQVPAAPAENAIADDSLGKYAGGAAGNSAPSAAAGESQGSAAEAGTQENSELPRGTVTVSTSAYPSIRVPPELKAQASGSGESFQIGEPISRIDPVYPEEAERQHVEGTVKLRVIVGKDGMVGDVEVTGGPPLLTPSAVDAIRQWRYKPTLLGDQAVEIADDITIVFRVPNATALANRP